MQGGTEGEEDGGKFCGRKLSYGRGACETRESPEAWGESEQASPPWERVAVFDHASSAWEECLRYRICYIYQIFREFKRATSIESQLKSASMSTIC